MCGITAPLRRWMFACVELGDYEKAYRIQYAIRNVSRLSYAKECYQKALEERDSVCSILRECDGDTAIIAACKLAQVERNLNSVITFVKRGGERD